MSLPAERRNLAATRVPNGIRRGGRRTGLRTAGAAGLAAFFLLCLGYAAEARPARCYTSDDGFYGCDFVAGPQGGFTISAAGIPTVILNIDAPGVAFGFAELGGRNVPLPGRYHRSDADRACWE